MIDETLFDAEEKMEKAVSVARDDLSSIPTYVPTRKVLAHQHRLYGSMTPITQLSSINVPEARLVVIKPYEATSCATSRTRSATPTSASTPATMATSFALPFRS